MNTPPGDKVAAIYGIPVIERDPKEIKYWIFGWCQLDGNAPEWCRLTGAGDLDTAQTIGEILKVSPLRLQEGRVLATKVEYHAEGWIA
jgi:hypothetical protein